MRTFRSYIAGTPVYSDDGAWLIAQRESDNATVRIPAALFTVDVELSDAVEDAVAAYLAGLPIGGTDARLVGIELDGDRVLVPVDTFATQAELDALVVTGGGISVASTAEAKAGTNDTKAMTPAKAAVVAEKYNVERAGALGDDTTNNSTAFATAAATVAAADGSLYVPPGVWRVLNAPVLDNVHWHGAGIGATVVKLVPSSNGSVFLTDNWATLSAGNTAAGPRRWSIRNMTIDANGANNATSSWGITAYGSDFLLENLEIINHRTAAIRSQWTSVLGNQHMSARVRDVTTWTLLPASGIVWNGPHDSRFSDVSVVAGAFTTGQRGFMFGTNAFGTRLHHCHTWGPHEWAAEVASDGIWFGDCYLEGGQSGQLYVKASYVDYRGGWLYGNQTPGAKGVELGVAAGAVASGCNIDTTVIYCRGGALGMINQVSNKINLHVHRDTTDPVEYGTASNPLWSDVSLQIEGTAGADEYEQIRRRMIIGNRSSAAQPALAVRAHASQTAAIQVWQDTSGAATWASVGANGTLTINGGAWNSGHLVLGGYHLFMDAAGRLRAKAGVPTSDSDGTIIGTQS